MTIGIKVTLQPNGNLLLQANNDTRADLAHALKQSYQHAEGDVLEMLRGSYTHRFPDGTAFHYTLENLDPGDIFALTDMPLFADTVRDDDDAVRVYGPVWGFADYQIRDYIRELAHTGRTILSRVADYGDGMTFPSRFGKPADRALADKIAVEAFEHCLDGAPVVEQVPDLHGEAGDTIARLVGFATRPPPPVIAPLL